MSRWEIRLANQGPIRVNVEDERNLAEEYEMFEAWYHARRWWHRRRSPFWRVTDDVVLHAEIVAGVCLKPVRPEKRAIGFLREGVYDAR